MTQLEIVNRGVLWDGPAGAYMPSITRLRSGAYLACQHLGTGLGSADNRLHVLRSTDGVSWEPLGEVPRPDSAWAYRGPDIEETPGGELILTACRFENSDAQLFDPDTEALQRPENLLFRSGDGGEHWSAPEVIPVPLSPRQYTANKAGRLVQFAADRWMFPFETWKPAGWEGPPDQKAAAVFSSDQGRTWGDLTVIADDPSGSLLWWDQMNTRLADGRLYVMLWTHRYGTKEDLAVHWVASEDQGRSWSLPRPTNLPGQVCCPIGLPDGRVAAIYNHRQAPEGVRVAISEDLSQFDRAREVTVFAAGEEANLGNTDHSNFLAEHLLIAFGKPQGILEPDGSLLTCFWCTVGGRTHTRWVRLRVVD